MCFDGGDLEGIARDSQTQVLANRKPMDDDVSSLSAGSDFEWQSEHSNPRALTVGVKTNYCQIDWNSGR